MSRGYAWIALITLASIGCGGNGPRNLTPDAREREIITEVGELYRQYSFTKKKPPQSFSDLAPFEPILPVGYGAVKDGSIVLRYGATMANTDEGPPVGSSDEVLAYEKKVPESGGTVLMLNRETRTMTADEFKAARKAGKD